MKCNLVGDVKPILGVPVKAFKGDIPTDKRASKKPEHIEILYILFDNGESYLKLEDQDTYSYHDCSSSAKETILMHNPTEWDRILRDHPDAEGGLGW